MSAEKKCSKCGVMLPLESFATQGGMRKDIIRAACRKCHSAQTAARRAAVAADPSSRPKRHRTYVMRKYGITWAEYDVLFAEPVCRICGTTSDIAVDHDHVTGKVRGLLCGPHNRALGLFQDDPFLLREAAHYIEKFNKESV